MAVYLWGILTFLGVVCQVVAPPSAHGASASVVRSIEFDRQPIFSEDDRARFPWLPLSWVDRLHVDTRTRVIRRELLFREGQRVRQEELDESARKLRGTGFFSDARIEVLEAPGDSVDVRVVTRELWTTAIDFSYEKFEDDRLWSLRFRERNFLGSARSLEFGRSEDLDRSSWSVGVGDRQLFGGKWQANLVRADADDGESFGWSLNRPFFETLDLHQLRSSYFHGGSSPRYYLSRDRYVRPHLDFTELEVLGQRRVAVRPRAVWRAGLGLMMSHQRFESGGSLAVSDPSGVTGETATLPGTLAENRRWHTPVLSLERKTRRYAKTRYLFAMGRTEDVPLGSDFELRLGWTTRALRSSQSGLYFEVEEEHFVHHGGRSFDRVQLHGQGLLGSSKAVDTSVRLQLSSYRGLARSTTVAVSLLGAMGSGLERHRVFNLGLESGLRAARFRELTGDRLLRANAELRWVYEPGLWSFLTPGLAAFSDLGTAWFESERDLGSRDLRGAIGAGLRIGFSRAANEVPIRVDLAWPLLYPSEQSSPVLSIGTGHVF